MTPTNPDAPGEACPEIPFFGARYPDARCIDGWLWDLDSCDEPGGPLFIGGDTPCPFCNEGAFIERYSHEFAEQIIVDTWDDEKDIQTVSDSEAMAQALVRVSKWIKELRERYT